MAQVCRCVYATRVTTSPKSSILHVCARDTIRKLRDDILRLQGYEVISTSSAAGVLAEMAPRHFSLVLVDIEGDGRVSEAEQLCDDIRSLYADQPVAFVCSHRVSIRSHCPDEVIRSEFSPEALVRGIQQIMA